MLLAGCPALILYGIAQSVRLPKRRGGPHICTSKLEENFPAEEFAVDMRHNQMHWDEAQRIVRQERRERLWQLKLKGLEHSPI